MLGWWPGVGGFCGAVGCRWPSLFASLSLGETQVCLLFPLGQSFPVCLRSVGLWGSDWGAPCGTTPWSSRELHQCAIFGGPEKPKPGPSDTLGRLSVTGLSNASSRQGYREQAVLWKLGVGFWGLDVGQTKFSPFGLCLSSALSDLRSF